MSPVWQVAPHPDATDREGPGMFREHDIQPFGAGMAPPSWPLVPARVQDWIDEANAAAAGEIHGETGVPLPEVLARLHDGFEKVHPFIDGNGRTGRLLLNLVLVRLGYPPIIVLKQQRPAYLAALQRADDGDYGPLGEILARAMYDNLNRFIFPSLAGPARLVPLPALVDKDLSLVALRQAAQRGRLDAVQSADGVWRSSRKAVEQYRRTRRRRRAT
jgi:Fic/DOC family